MRQRFDYIANSFEKYVYLEMMQKKRTANLTFKNVNFFILNVSNGYGIALDSVNTTT